VKNEPIGVGLVGYGMAGRVFHAPLISAVNGLELRAIVQRHGEEAARDYPAAATLRRPEDLLLLGDIDLVVIATPNRSHFDLAQRALATGRHVVVDKPFTVSAREARDLIGIAGDRGQLLSVFQNRRWDGDFLTVRRLIASGALGRIVSLESRFDRYRNTARPGAWRESSGPGSGVLYDLGSHLIDQAVDLFGSPQRVIADVRRERDFSLTDDAFDLWLDYDGVRVVLSAGMLVRERTPRFVVRGTRATYVKHGLDPQEEMLRAGASPRQAGWGAEASDRWGVLLSDEGERPVETERGDYTRYYENIRDAIAAGAPLEVTAEQALMTIELVEFARQSSSAKGLLDSPNPSPPRQGAT
jgi:scyllo-inositol 2-dehydrogenase (NADP+)